jgi:peptidoglycan/xylan/chitin deacetylase (PgdA/CDA1 family)
MMYFKFTPKKTITFGIFMACLALALAASMGVTGTLPEEYLRIRGLTAMSKMPFQSIKYGLDYTSESNPGRSTLASIGNLFSSAKLDVDTGVSTTTAKDVPVLLYHGIVEVPDRFSMTKETFAEQMFALKRAGYHTITLEDFQLFLEGKKQLDDKSFLLTFDDARIDAYWGADPVLQALGFTAVMYVATTDSINVPRPLPSYYIHEGLLGRMVRSGRWELGSHAVQEHTGFIPIDAAGTKGNFLSNKMWLAHAGRLETDDEYRARVTKELVQSKVDLEKSFGVPITSFSYPFGDYGQQTRNNPNAQQVIESIVKSNYDMAFNQVWATDALFNSNYPGTDRIHLRRIESGTDWSGERLLSLIENARSKNIAFSDDFSKNHGWKYNWGKATLENGKLQVVAGDTTTGSIAFLDGTHDWDDYFFTVSASQQAGEYTSLVSRFQDNENYVSCWFSDGEVKIVEKLNDQSRNLVKVRHTLRKTSNESQLGMSVQGEVVRCFDGAEVVAQSGDLNPRLSSGGIAISVWDEQVNNAAVIVRSLRVVPPDRVPNLLTQLARP